jgi:putative transposase
MPRQTAPMVALSVRVRKILEETARQRSTEHRLVVRALLILAMADCLNNHELSRTRKLDRGTIRYWRSRWIALTPQLVRAEEAGVKDEDLRDLVINGLSDLPRSGTPPKFTAEQIVGIVAVSCEDPAASGRPISHWTQPELAREVEKRGIVESISPASIGRFLK